MNDFHHLISGLLNKPPQRLAVAASADREVLTAVQDAADQGLAEPILVGPKDRIEALLRQSGRTFRGQIVDATDEEDAAAKAVCLVREGEADVLMKGMLPTKTLLRAVLSKDNGLRGEGLLSHVGLAFSPLLGRALFISDAAINIAPDLEEKKGIIENAAATARALGYERPIVCVISAIEKVNPAMPSSVDADKLKQYFAGRNDLLVGGPFALDNALFSELAVKKGLHDEAAGHADILLCPTIEAGNVLLKSLSLLGGIETAGIVAGAARPIVLTSRTDFAKTRFNSIAFALAVAGGSPERGGSRT